MAELRCLPRPERRTRTDLTITAAITAATVALGGLVWLGSDARSSNVEATAPVHELNADASEEAVSAPGQLAETWSAPDEMEGLMMAEGGVATKEDPTTVVMRAAATGEEAWRYTAAHEICAAVPNWETITVIMRGPKGCGQAVSLDADTGEYRYTRDALGADTIHAFNSKDNIGLLSRERVELWRSDLVRTVEVGKQEAPAKPGLQEHLECSFTSALTHSHLLVTVQSCPDQDKKLVRLLKAVPEESNEPEALHEYTVPADSEVVAVSNGQAVIYAPGNGTPARDAQDNEGSRFQVLDEKGNFAQFPADVADLGAHSEDGLWLAQVADLPQHKTWFDGRRLVSFNTSTLAPEYAVEGALGTGDVMGSDLLVPVAEGVAVVDPATGGVLRVIPVDRGGYTGPVTLRVAGTTVVEQRGDEVVALAG